MNDFRCIGRFVYDPTLSTIVKPNGEKTYVTKFKLAVTDKFKKNNTTELTKRTAFIPFEAYDSGAKVICENYKKGDPILIYALVKTFRNKADESKTDIVFRVNHFEFLPSPKVLTVDEPEWVDDESGG